MNRFSPAVSLSVLCAFSAVVSCVPDRVEENVSETESERTQALVASCAAVDDTRLEQKSPTTPYGAATILYANGKANGLANTLSESTLRFNLATCGIPAGATIDSARLRLRLNAALPAGANTAPYEFYELKKDFVGSEASWNVAKTGVSWGAAGANSTSGTSIDRGTTVLGSFQDTAALGGGANFYPPMNAAFLSLVRDWYSGATPNRGLLLRPSVANSQGCGTAFAYSSKEGAAAPVLEVTYSEPASGAATTLCKPVADTRLEQKAPTTNYGIGTTSTNGQILYANGTAGTSANQSSEAALKFDVAGCLAAAGYANRSVTGAKLSLFTAVASSGSSRPYQVYQLTRAWVETQATWNIASTGTNWSSPGATGVGSAGDRADVVLGSFQSSGPVGFYFDIPSTPALTTLVSDWYTGGQSNSGLLVRPDVVNPLGCTSAYGFNSREVAGKEPILHVTHAPRQAAACGNVASGGQEVRQRFQRSMVSAGQSCPTEQQSRVCTDGTWSAWTGTYQYPACSVLPQKRVGIFYLAWHAFGAGAMNRIAPAQQFTVEDVLRSGTRSAGEIVNNHGLFGDAGAFHYHVRPNLGFYCMYRPRPGETPYPGWEWLNCPTATTVAREHAQQLWAAGVDFVYFDLTNIPYFSPFADVIGLRPLQVLLEEWATLREQGVMTPQVAVWAPLPVRQAGEEALTYLVDALLPTYNQARYRDLILTDGATGKKVIFLTDHGSPPTDPAAEAVLRSNGGRNDIISVPLWGLIDGGRAAAGRASWMQPCERGGQFTTLISASTPCGQRYPANTPIGSVLSVSTSYQLGYASLPYQATGKNNGLTFKLQFDTALGAQPNYLLINSWNEFIAQPQANPFPESVGGLRYSMGMNRPSSRADGTAPWLWVDMYGSEFVRDIEPTAEYGNAYYDLMASCLRVFRSGATSCSNSSEACCQRAEELVQIHSLRWPDPSDQLNTHHVLVASELERTSLLGQGWEQVCNLGFGPSPLCADGAGLTGDGPFQVYAHPGAGRVPLYRCYSGVANFFSHDSGCEGRTFVGLIGYISTSRTSATPRPFKRCYNGASSTHFHWLDENCPSVSIEDSPMGYVR